MNLYLIYIDESGKPSRKDLSPLYVQAALILADDEWQTVDNAVNALKAKWFPKLAPSDIELHAYEIVNQKGSYKTLGRMKSFKLLEDVFDLIAGIDCTLVASVIHKDKLRKLKTTDEVELWSHRFLFERVCKFLDKENNKRILANEPSQYGILMIDSITPKYNNTIRKKYQEFFRIGTHFQQNKYLVEDPLFVDSQYRNMAQLVDVAAYLVNRYAKSAAKPKTNWNDTDHAIKRGYQTVKARFDTGPRGQIDGCGIKHFP